MSAGINALDHLAVMVTDLTLAGAAYERLGFNMTPVSQHSGALTAGAEAEPWGTANRCAMFRQGYLELMGVIDPDLYDNHVPEFLDRYEGIHILAFGTDDAAATADSLAAAGFGATGVHALARPLDTPEGERLAKFNLVRVPPAETPEGRVLAIEHLTRDYLWQARYLDHPNGAVALTGLVVCVGDVDEAARRYSRYFGLSPKNDGVTANFELETGRFVLLNPTALVSRYGMEPPTLPFAAAFSVAVKHLNDTQKLLEQNNVEFRSQNGAVLVSPAEAHGATIMFAQA